VDYARGDGLTIGPGQEKEWAEPQLLDPTPKWALHYRGLWGLYAGDPVSSENAPAGPVYNRDGSMRRFWYDPLGWVGLDKLPPPNQTLSHILEQWLEVEARQTPLTETIAAKSYELVKLGVEANAMRGQAHLRTQYAAQQEKIATLSEELNQLRAQVASDQALLISFIILVLFAQQFLVWGLTALVSLMVFVEASFRRQLARLVTSLTIGLALVAALILVYDFFWQIVVVAALLTGGYIIWENLRELRG
jgi:hypothetical protein